MQSSRSPANSPLLLSHPAIQAILQQQHFSLDQPPQEEPQEQGLPSAATALKNLLTRHGQEIREATDTLPKVGQHSAKKAFREFYLRESAHIFEFLDRPLLPTQTLTQSQQLLKRFGKGEYTGNKNKYRDLVLDCSCNEVMTQIQDAITAITSPEKLPFSNWVRQTRAILEQWRQACQEYSTAEQKLKQEMSIFDEVHKKATLLLQLPQTEGYEQLATATEGYVKHLFEEHEIESTYQECITALKKITILSDALGSIRQMVNASTEPLCPICFKDAVSVACVPCGHTLCTGCSQKQTTTCFVCRSVMSTRIKIFFS